MKILKAAGALALALSLTPFTAAYAEEAAAPSSSADTTSYGNAQKPGTSGIVAEAKDAASGMAEHWKAPKTCTDETGNVLKHGDKGFKTCIEALRKKEQMGAMAPTQPESGASAPSGSGQ